MMETLNVLSSKKIIENEMEVLRSRALMIDVVKKLHLYAPIYEKTKIRPVSLYATSPVIIESINPDSLVETKDKTYFKYNSVKKEIIIYNKEYPLNEWVNTPYGKLKFIPQNLQYNSENPLYFALVIPKKVAASLVSLLDISPANKLSSVIRLSIKDEVPKRSEDILNSLIVAYNRASASEKNILATKTLEFVDERLKYVSHDLDSIEKNCNNIKRAIVRWISVHRGLCFFKT